MAEVITRSRLQKAGLLLLILAVFDALVTDIGIRHAHIEEANPLMRFVYEQHIVYFYSIKIGLPLVLLHLLQSIKPKRLWTILMGGALILYLLVSGLHLYWITHV
ncbi:DUF5658 family protein [Sporosarcina sp. FSL W7-1349]|uniref:DUF5658 family protein n=1 Tax=Bacillales TaxID=1385 RepID=UPI000581E20D|nr:DUF5658 family protein [Bacillus sp. OxB-1]BAQ11962.1 hypothetical protein OXB_3493 [Bacillus sp. OxB-1]